MTHTGQQPPPSVPVRSTGRDERWQVAGLCFVLAAITFIVFGQTLGFGFINYDDNIYLYDNPVVARGLTLKGFAWAFTYGKIGHWHPLTWLTHMADCQIYGLRPGGHHLTNVLIHTTTVILLFLVLRQMTASLWRSAFVAAVFAIHPLRAESVAWVAERKDVLSGLFFMLTLWAYVRYTRQPSRSLLVIVAVLFGLGLLCKNMLVTLPFVLLLLDWWPLRRFEAVKNLPGLIREKIPLFLLAAASCIATSLVPEKVFVADRVQFLGRMENALVSYVIYMRQMVFPSGLAVPYLFPPGGFSVSEITLASLLLLALSGLAWRRRYEQPYLLVGWLWFLGMLVPAIGLVQISYYARADRYTYLPEIGLALAGTWGAAEWSAGWKHRKVVLGGAAIVVVGALMVCAFRQTSYWRDSESLWTHTLACTQRNETALHNLGAAFAEDGRLDDAIHQYRLALEIDPHYSRPHFRLASALLQKGNLEESLTQFMDTLQIDPNDAEAHTAFGVALLRKGKVREATAHFLKALQLKPDDAQAHYNLGKLLLDRGGVDDAITHFQQAMQTEPDHAEVHDSLGSAFVHKGRLEEAGAQFQMALQLKSDDSQAHYNLGNILLQTGQADEAIDHYQRAVKIDPNYGQAHANLGAALLQKGDADNALLQFQRALEIDPSNAPAHVNLGRIFLQRGKVGDAIVQFQKALQIHPDDPDVQSNLAWLLATSEDGSLRNGKMAVRLAQRANELSSGRNPAILSTLAAAFAETGQFDDARRSIQAAIDLLKSAHQQELAGKLNAELKRYEAGLPLRQ